MEKSQHFCATIHGLDLTTVVFEHGSIVGVTSCRIMFEKELFGKPCTHIIVRMMFAETFLLKDWDQATR
jgi:hypothetical protein